jgi:hypothetical protein
VLRPEDQGDLGTAVVRLGEELGAVHPDVPVLAGAHALAEEEPAAAQLLSVEDVVAEGGPVAVDVLVHGVPVVEPGPLGLATGGRVIQTPLCIFH